MITVACSYRLYFDIKYKLKKNIERFLQRTKGALSYLVAQFVLLGRRVGGAGAVLVTVASVHVVDDGL